MLGLATRQTATPLRSFPALPASMVRACICTVLLVTLLHPAVALASPPPEAPTETRTVTKWYGWQIIAVDAASALIGWRLVDDGVFDGNNNWGYFTTGSLLTASPVIHGLHGNVRSLLWSLSLRTAMSVGLGLLHSQSCDSAEDRQGCEAASVALGALGLMGAAVIDVTWLARKQKVESVSDRGITARIWPSVQVRPNGATVGLGLRF